MYQIVQKPMFTAIECHIMFCLIIVWFHIKLDNKEGREGGNHILTLIVSGRSLAPNMNITMSLFIEGLTVENASCNNCFII